MGLLLKLIPEPWATLLMIGAVVAAWLYGDLSGGERQAQKDKIARLDQTVTAMERQRDASVEIQTKMAQRLAELRGASLQREKETNDLVEQLRAKTPADSCILDDAQRLRLRSIRIGPARADTGAR